MAFVSLFSPVPSGIPLAAVWRSLSGDFANFIPDASSSRLQFSQPWSPPGGCKRSALELYAGSEVLTKGLAGGSFWASGHDVKKSRACDVTIAANQKRYLEKIEEWDYAHEGLCCQTWSVAANGKYRDKFHIWGYPKKHPRFLQRRATIAHHANKMARFTLDHFEKRLLMKKTSSIDNPAGSSFFKLKRTRELLKHPDVRFVPICYCRYGTIYMKNIRLMTAKWGTVLIWQPHASANKNTQTS